MQSIRIGTRGSALALAQAQLAKQALEAAHPGLHVVLTIINTAGDRRTDIPLHEVNAATGTGDKGVFIAAIEEELAAGRIDCAVHSLKDMPGVLDERFALAAVLPREEQADVLVLRSGAEPLTIATGSVRRSRLVRSCFPGARVVPVRGNVATRLRKLAEHPEWSGTLLARAGLNRLGYDRRWIELQGEKYQVIELPLREFPPALGQGAIALETRRGDAAEPLVAAVNHAPTMRCIACERRFLALLKADCSVPVGGSACETLDGGLELSVCYYPAGSDEPLRISASGCEPEGVAQAVFARLQEALSARVAGVGAGR
ncbi:MAG: hydroxymethylbilane synthase [Akkermansia sp.]